MRVYVFAVVTALVLLSGATSGFTQEDDGYHGARDGHHRGMRGDRSRDPARMIEKMSRHLDLDELQQEQMNNIVLAAQPEMDALHDRQRANRKAQHELDANDPDYSAKLSDIAAESGELTASRTMLMGSMRSEISAVLTEEQRAKLGERSDRRRHHGRHRVDEQ